VTVSRILPASRLRSAGFSLVELMIAMAVGLGLIAAVSALFAATSSGRAELSRTGRMFENGRYAQELLAEDLKLAGYYGELPLLVYGTTFPDPCTVDPAALGWQAAPPATVPPALVGYREGDAIPACIADRLAGTDVIVVRRVATATAPIGTIPAGTAYLQTSRCADDVPPFALATSAAALPLRGIGCDAIADPRRFVVRIYYVARCNVCSRDTTPTLKRIELIGGQLVVTPLVESIENLRFDYGFDVDADGVPDRYLRGRSGVAGAPDDDWGNVVAARVHVLVRTAEIPTGTLDDSVHRLGLSGELGPFNDGWKRTVFAAAVRLTNPAGRRE
jgi:type IV pilus assembly protein PilW